MDCIIAMRSQTYASRGGRLLRKEGISYSIVSLDPSLTRNGCSFGLRIPSVSCGDAQKVFDAHKLSYGDIIGGSQ